MVPTSDVKERDGRRQYKPLAKPTVAVLAAWIKEQGKDGFKIFYYQRAWRPTEFRLGPVSRY